MSLNGGTELRASDLLVLVLGSGPVVSYVDSSDFSITNVTLPGHRFYPGKVIRSVITENGEIDIQTTGTGTGPHPWLNEHAADLYWGSIDALIRDFFIPVF
jgi:hypothetical protein